MNVLYVHSASLCCLDSAEVTLSSTEGQHTDTEGVCDRMCGAYFKSFSVFLLCTPTAA